MENYFSTVVATDVSGSTCSFRIMVRARSKAEATVLASKKVDSIRSLGIFSEDNYSSPIK